MTFLLLVSSGPAETFEPVDALRGVQTVHVVAEFTSNHQASPDTLYDASMFRNLLENRCRAAGLKLASTDEAADLTLRLLVREHFTELEGPSWVFSIMEMRATRKVQMSRGNQSRLEVKVLAWSTDPIYVYVNGFRIDNDERVTVEQEVEGFLNYWKASNAR